MQTTVLLEQRGGRLGSLAQWWRNWKRGDAAQRAPDCCGDRATALDSAAGPSEVRTLPGRWPE
jgi:hypothetical protein